MKRKAEFIMKDVGGANFLVPLGMQVMNLNGLITLNKTAACVWELLAQEHTVDELTATLTDLFDVETEIARADVQIFVDNITRLGLLEP